MIPSITLPGILVFSIFMILNGVIAYICWRVIRSSWNRLRESELSSWERRKARFDVLLMVLPFIAFSFGFVFFMIQALKSL